MRLEQTSPPCVCQDCTRWVRPSGPARSTGRGAGGGPDLRQGLAHSKGPMKVRPRPSLPQNLVISGGAVPGIISQEVSPLDGVRLLLGELQGRSGNRPLCTVSLCQTL